jgi:hypothetical protein
MRSLLRFGFSTKAVLRQTDNASEPPHICFVPHRVLPPQAT